MDLPLTLENERDVYFDQSVLFVKRAVMVWIRYNAHVYVELLNVSRCIVNDFYSTTFQTLSSTSVGSSESKASPLISPASSSIVTRAFSTGSAVSAARHFPTCNDSISGLISIS